MRSLVAVVLLLGLAAIPFASAEAALVMQPDLCNGAQGSCPQTDWPFGTATFTTTATGVNLSLQASLNADLSQQFDEWWFNLDPNIVPTGAVLRVTETNVGAPQATSVDSNHAGVTPFVGGVADVTITQNDHNIDGAGSFDFGFNFDANGVNQLFDSQLMTFTIQCLSGCTGTLTENAFFFLSSGSPSTPYDGAPGSPNAAADNVNGPFVTVAHVPGPSGAYIAWFGVPGGPVPPGETVPEPGTLVLLGLGLSALGAYGWRRHR